MRLCPGGCGKKFNKGVRRHVMNDDGSIEVKLVCKPCAFGRAIQIVVPAKGVCRTCHTGKAAVCHGCSNEQAHKAVRVALKPWAEFFTKQAAVRREDGTAKGLIAAAEYLENGKAVQVDAE